MKHTKGPWIVNPENHTEVLANGRTAWNSVVANCPTGKPDSELVAAAPDLLFIAEQAKELLEVLAPIFKIIDDAKTVKNVESILATINAVLAKAKGE